MSSHFVYYGLRGHGSLGLQLLIEHKMPPAIVVTAVAAPAAADPFSVALNQRRDSWLAQFPPLEELCRSAGIPCYFDDGGPAPAWADEAAQCKPDFALIVNFKRILPSEIFSLPVLGTFNVHPSLLPAYRGPQPIFWALHEGETHTGFTLHKVDTGIDTGPALLCRELRIAPEDSFGSLYQRMGTLLPDLIIPFCRKPASFQPLPQSSSRASYFPNPTTQTVALDPLTLSCDAAWRTIKAGNPIFPAYTGVGQHICFIWSARPASPPPGAVRGSETVLMHEKQLFLQCRDGYLRIDDYLIAQLEQ